MPETSRVLYLHSPSGSDVAVYKWPLHITETWNEANEIAETVRWACSDFPELRTAMENCILSHFDPSSYESMKLFCEKYNRAVDNIRKLWSGRQPPPCIDVPPTHQHLKHIITQVYNRSISKPEELNNYEPFSPEVYGETSFDLIHEVISVTRMNENDIFLDLGSGVGQIVLQVAAEVGCKSYGIEKAEIPIRYAEEMDRQFIKWMDFYGKSYGEYELLKGDFLEDKFDEILYSATIIFCNNFAFGPNLNHKLKLKFQNLRDGVKIVSSREFCPLNFRITQRKMSDIGAMMRVVQLSPLKGHVSWTGKPINYYLHIIDRTQLEEFFHRQKHMGEAKSEGSSCTPFSDNETSSSSSSSSDSSDEETSMDSSNEEDLFPHNSQEKYHFPPSSSPPPSLPPLPNEHYPETHSYKKPHLFPSHKFVPTTSAVLKKATPPLGSTHVPRPHPQVTQPTKQHRPKSLQSRKNRARPSSHKAACLNLSGTFDSNAMTSLFESFSQQNQAYLNQLETPKFKSWLTDAVEKEKMKRDHLRGIIDHLEKEVSSLSHQTIATMKESMMNLGITNLTPEGLLMGAKEIVCLNRRLRKEIHQLEKEVLHLKEQNDTIKDMKIKLKDKESDGHTHQPLHVTPPTVMIPLSNTPATTTTTKSPDLSHLLRDTTTTTTTKAPKDSTNDDQEMMTIQQQRLTPSSVVTVIVEEESQLGLSHDLSSYEISLETIDQAVLELGPFAKPVDNNDRQETVPLENPSCSHGNGSHSNISAVAEMTKREAKKKSNSPRPSRGVDEVIREKGKRGNGRRKAQKEVSPALSPWQPIEVPLTHGLPLSVGKEGHNKMVQPPMDIVPSHSVSQETAAVEAMLELSGHGSVARSNTKTTKDATPTTEIPSYTAISHQTDQPTIRSIPPSFSLPPLSKLPPAPSDKRRTSSSSSSHRSTGPLVDERSTAFSPQRATPPPNHMGVATPSRHAHPSSAANNPFWPVPIQTHTSSAQTASFPYQFVNPNWNLYPSHYYAAPPVATSNAIKPPSLIDHSSPFRSQVISPYFMRYPYGVLPVATQFNPINSLATSTSFYSQATSSSPSPLLTFKSLHNAAFNPSLTPPTLHPLGVPQMMDKSHDVSHQPNNNSSWMATPTFINQYHSAAMLNTPQYAALGPGGAQLPLHLLTNVPTLAVGAPVAMETDHSSHDSKRSAKIDSLHNELLSSPWKQADHNHEGMTGEATVAKRPNLVPLPVKTDGRKGGGKGDKGQPDKIKLKIHQLHNEDFRANERATQQRKRKGRSQKTKEEPICEAPPTTLTASERVVQESPLQDDEVDIISIDTTPTEDHTLPVNLQLDEIETLSATSEGTMSASPSPSPTPVPSTITTSSSTSVVTTSNVNATVTNSAPLQYCTTTANTATTSTLMAMEGGTANDSITTNTTTTGTTSGSLLQVMLLQKTLSCESNSSNLIIDQDEEEEEPDTPPTKVLKLDPSATNDTATECTNTLQVSTTSATTGNVHTNPAITGTANSTAGVVDDVMDVGSDSLWDQTAHPNDNHVTSHVTDEGPSTSSCETATTTNKRLINRDFSYQREVVARIPSPPPITNHKPHPLPSDVIHPSPASGSDGSVDSSRWTSHRDDIKHKDKSHRRGNHRHGNDHRHHHGNHRHSNDHHSSHHHKKKHISKEKKRHRHPSSPRHHYHDDRRSHSTTPINESYDSGRSNESRKYWNDRNDDSRSSSIIRDTH